MTKEYKRNAETGLIEGLDYKYSEDGTIDWRSMIPDEYLYPNKDFFNRRNEPIPDSIEGLKDHELCIKIGGIRKLAKWRGFTKVDFIKLRAEDHIVSLKCIIEWIPNTEEPYPTIYSDNANASIENTNGFGKDFLETIASNRSFIRAVRNYLGIDIVGFDELNQREGQANNQNNSTSMPIKSLLSAANVSENDFDGFIDILRDLYLKNLYKHPNTKNWKTWKDIPVLEIAKIKKAIKANV
jgi:hypothetical protein